MIYVIFAYIVAIVVIHILLFTRANYMSKILLINSAISCLAVTMLLLSYYFKDTNFIDVIFFYIIMSPIGFYGIFIYYKNTSTLNKKKTDIQNTTQDNSMSKNKIENNQTLKAEEKQQKALNKHNNNHKNNNQPHKNHNSTSIKKQQSKHKYKNNHDRTKNAGNKQKNKL